MANCLDICRYLVIFGKENEDDADVTTIEEMAKRKLQLIYFNP